MPLYNPLPQLMNRPQGMQGLAMLGGALSNIQRQKQAQAQQQATGQALGSLATYGMEDQGKAQALSQLAEANPQMFMQYQQMQQSMGRGRENPEIVRIRDIGDNAFLKGQEIVADYLKTEDPIKRQELIQQYNQELDKNYQSDRALSGLGVAGHSKNKMMPFNQAVSKMADFMNAERLMQAELGIKTAEQTIKEEQAKEVGTRSELNREQLKQARMKTQEVQEKQEGGTADEKAIAQLVNELISYDAKIAEMTKGEAFKNWLSFGKLPSSTTINANNFKEALLREKSGAAIGLQEDAQEGERYIPQPFDSKEVLREKAIVRQNLINRLVPQAGKAWKKGLYQSPFVFEKESIRQESKPQDKQTNRDPLGLGL